MWNIKKSYKAALPTGILLLATFLLIITLLAYLGTTCRLFDTFCHFKVPIVLGAIFLATATAFCKQFRKTNLTLISLVILLNLIEILPWYFSPNNTEGEATTFRICMINVLKRNNNFALTKTFIASTAPDIIVLMEVDERWLDKLQELDKNYPQKVVSKALGNDGIILYSKFPIINHTEITLSPKVRPNFKTTIEINDRIVTFFVAHPVSPTRKKGKWEDRNIHLANLAQAVNKVAGPTIVIADLNTTMWSPFYKKLINETNLTNTRQGFGINGSYPAPYALISGLPIDHILISQHFTSRAFKSGSHIGSDHLPIVVDISFIK